MKAVILAGGFGTRLRPLTYTVPKPMIPVLNQPELYYLINNLAAAGFSEVIITTNYMSEVIERYIRESDFGIPVYCICETTPNPLGSAGALKTVEEFLDGDFAVLQCDSVSDMDLEALVAFHDEKKGVVTIAVMEVEDTREFGIVQADENERIIRFQEKPKPEESFSNLANTGFYIFNHKILDYIPKDQFYDFSCDVFPKLLSDNQPMYCYTFTGFWIDIGSRVNNYLAGMFWLLKDRAEIDSASVQGVKLTPPYLIGRNTKFEAGAVIGPQAIISDNCTIGADSVIKQAVLYDNVILGEKVKLERCVVADNNMIGDGVAIEEFAIVGKGCNLGERTEVKAFSKIGPYCNIDNDVTVDGVVCPRIEELSKLQTMLEKYPAFRNLNKEQLHLCTFLAEFGELQARTLSSLSKIPYSQIHQWLYSLEKINLVVSYGDVPKLFSLKYENPELIQRAQGTIATDNLA
jgi:mannose-1-phosphate guanylyltransferase/phosphomannomutase